MRPPIPYTPATIFKMLFWKKQHKSINQSINQSMEKKKNTVVLGTLGAQEGVHIK